MKPAIIIPVYNHHSQVASVIREALKLDLPIYVIDDGSTDNSPTEINAIKGIYLLQHQKNRGKGAALLTGFHAAFENGCNWALTLDGDGQHKPEDAPALLNAVKDGKRGIVIGTRQGMEESINVPWTSRFGRKFSNFWVFVSGGPKLMDSQSGFRLYPLPEALQLEVKARRYQFEVEILVRARQKGIEALEVPVQVVYQKKGVRVSHFRPWLDFWRNSSTFSRLIFQRIFSVFRP